MAPDSGDPPTALLALMAAWTLVAAAAGLPLLLDAARGSRVLARLVGAAALVAVALILGGGPARETVAAVLFVWAFGVLVLGATWALRTAGLGPVMTAWVLTAATALALTLPIWSGAWVEAASDAAVRGSRISRVLRACPLAALWGDLLGIDFLKSPPWYRHSVIGAYYPYAYPDWRGVAWGLALGGAVLGGLAQLGRAAVRRRAGALGLVGLVSLVPGLVAAADQEPLSDNPRVTVASPDPAWIHLGLGWRAWTIDGRWRREGLGLDGTVIDVADDLERKSWGHAPALRYVLQDRHQTLTIDYQRTIVQADRHIAARDLTFRGVRFLAGDLLDASAVFRRTGLAYRRAIGDLGPLRLELGAGGRHLGWKLRVRDLSAGFATRAPENVWLPQGEAVLRLFPDRPLELWLRGAGFSGADAAREVRHLELQAGLALRLSELVWLEADYLSERLFARRDGRGELELSAAGPGLFVVFRF